MRDNLMNTFGLKREAHYLPQGGEYPLPIRSAFHTERGNAGRSLSARGIQGEAYGTIGDLCSIKCMRPLHCSQLPEQFPSLYIMPPLQILFSLEFNHHRFPQCTAGFDIYRITH